MTRTKKKKPDPTASGQSSGRTFRIVLKSGNGPVIITGKQFYTFSKQVAQKKANVRPRVLLVCGHVGETFVVHRGPLAPNAGPEIRSISPLAYARAVWNVFWSAIRHPFTTTAIDLSTGRVVDEGAPDAVPQEPAPDHLVESRV
ncbi:MAG TPA: hypothetical protein VKE40_08590 [Gemmataceae bacterium]|nr:hypothetical protein [Gemmataceae bacterium]